MVSSKSDSRGWLEWSVAAESNRALNDLIDLLDRNGCEVQLVRISDCSGVLGLTSRQEEILKFAYSNGFYEYPRRISLRELSQIFEVSPSTVSEILRAGQRRVLTEYFGFSFS
jgi:predicted DNA binding protein